MSEILSHTIEEIEHSISHGWNTGVQLYVSLHGDVIANLGIGESRPNISMTASTIVEWASATKPITCSALALLWQRGLVKLDDPIIYHISEFGINGKESITIRHLLTHSGGLSDPVHNIMPFKKAVESVCKAPLIEEWIPGTRFAYNSVGMWIVAELITQISGLSFDQFVRTEIFEPLDLVDCWVGMPDSVFDAYGERIAIMPDFALSGTKEWVTWGRPTGGGHGPIGQLGGFYTALLNRQILSDPVIEAMTTRHCCGVYDEKLNATVDRGLGFMLSSSYAGHSYGQHASRRAYGHGGRNWCVAFADPTYQLAIAVYWNGMVDGDTHSQRQPRLLESIYRDLKLIE